MSTQSVIHSVQQQKSAVFPIPIQSPQTITQTELEFAGQAQTDRDASYGQRSGIKSAA
jgi:hypothetical protein